MGRGLTGGKDLAKTIPVCLLARQFLDNLFRKAKKFNENFSIIDFWG